MLTFLLLVLPAQASLWEDATSTLLGPTSGWSNEVTLVDLDGDGDLDIVLANGGDYSAAGTPELNQVWLNQGPGAAFVDGTDAALGSTPDLSRSIKAGDLDGDGVVDLFVSTTYQTPSRLFLGTGGGAMTEVSDSNLPRDPISAGDVELGDIDNDGDLDVVMADWGDGNPLSNLGGPVRVWRNDGNAVFTADTSPLTNVRFSWDMELADVDNDADLDVLVSCKSCTGSFLLHNDGSGAFTDVSSGMPQFSNNYEFEAMDVNADGFVDLVTINDGTRLTEHLFLNDGSGGFSDATALWWPDTEQDRRSDDNVITFVDYDSDGDADFLIGSLSSDDRLLEHTGNGFTQTTGVITGANSPGTLAMAMGDLNGDDRIDIVMAQGETASAEKIFLGVDVAPDTAAPHVTLLTEFEGTLPNEDVVIHARVHDTKTPVSTDDFVSVTLVSDAPARAAPIPMTWVGGAMWRVVMPAGSGTVNWQVCATDRADNEACSEERVAEFEDQGNVDTDSDLGTDTDDTDVTDGDDGLTDTGGGADGGDCGCQAPVRVFWAWPLALVAVALRRNCTLPATNGRLRVQPRSRRGHRRTEITAMSVALARVHSITEAIDL